MAEPKLSPKWLRLVIFWIGIIATVTYRAIIIFNHYKIYFWSDVLWYIGTIGFVIYFWHRFQISERRVKVIKEQNLEEKIRQSSLDSETKESVNYVIGGLSSSMEKWNYIAIFITSGLSLLFMVALSLFKLSK